MIEVVLVIIILMLLGVILFSGGGVVWKRRLLREIDDLCGERRKLLEANEALRKSTEMEPEVRAKRFKDMLNFIRELESLRCAVAGMSTPQKEFIKKYEVQLGPELLERIFASWPSIDPAAKRKLANELLVGEAGRAIMRGLSAGASMEKAAGDAGMPVMVARMQITRLQTLGYLDARMQPTDLGREALM